jgi:hypothetical protein
LFFFCSFQPSKELIVRDFEFRERMFTSITDLITLAIFLGISPPVKEGMTTYIRGNDKKDITPFRNFLKGKLTTGFHKVLEFSYRKNSKLPTYGRSAQNRSDKSRAFSRNQKFEICTIFPTDSLVFIFGVKILIFGGI